MEKGEKKLGLFSLVGIIISAIIGAGIFNLMKEMATTASAGITIIGWLITGLGMGALVFCMQRLSIKRPDLDAGIFSYAKAGFGDYIGFNAIWGYWISVIVANVAFGTLLFSALAYFFPIFGNGQNIPSIIGATVVLWLIHYVILKGLDKATLLNTVVAIAKLVPILIFIVCLFFGFQKELFFSNFFTAFDSNQVPISILEQLKGTVLSTVWVFIGIEGAIVFSGRAKKRSDVGKATILGFISVTLIYIFITVFSYGVFSQTQLQNIPNPAMAYVLEAIIGKTGAIIVNTGVIISIFGAWIATTLLAEEVAFQASISQLFPKIFSKQNKNNVPAHSVTIITLIVQVLLLSFLITDEAYSLLSKLSSATILLPYTCVALYQIKLSIQLKEKLLSKDILIGVLATLYMFWLIYGSGTLYFMLTILTLCPGSVMYIYVKKKNSTDLFNKYEWAIFSLISLLFLYGIFQFSKFGML
ncbi:arginine-ornithine antiporter [Enterococcus sp. JM4C]|uniref:basic amino acid/polyamine antiporter n=1 Tax=Candidatus Enterococcus huntleyi TaxID=1857217 RepID=UPI00137B6881|nr:basic amino acid/polyamine antiporter [Enterococcus sp. JM4C]KAF1296099.1 arginine-ornithine antiporter [Enterococcus sp. JM4C]